MRHAAAVALWGIYSDAHTEVDIGGNRDGLQALAKALSGNFIDLKLDEPPTEWASGNHALRAIESAPEPDARLCFTRNSEILVLSGRQTELVRIVGGAVSRLASGPSRINGVGAHVHLDPTSDPDHRWYSPESISLVVVLVEGEE